MPGSGRGRRSSRKLAPVVRRASSSMVPPCASMIRRQSASPRPLPFAFVVNSASKIAVRVLDRNPGTVVAHAQARAPVGAGRFHR